jgi:hypothetical protein
MGFNGLCLKNIIMSKENTNASSIVSKVWAFCQTLGDDGVVFDVKARNLQQAKH